MSAPSGTIEEGTHRFTVRVYYEDTDSGGIVYYANYLKFAERARTEMLRLAGINQTEMASRYGMSFAVRDCAIDFRRPAHLDDLLEVRSHLVEGPGRTRATPGSIASLGKRFGASLREIKRPAPDPNFNAVVCCSNW